MQQYLRTITCISATNDNMTTQMHFDALDVTTNDETTLTSLAHTSRAAKIHPVHKGASHNSE